jgi:hypothetical protein
MFNFNRGWAFSQGNKLVTRDDLEEGPIFDMLDAAFSTDADVTDLTADVAALDAAKVAGPGLRVVRGIVNTAVAGTIVEGTGFAINRTGAGILEVTFTVPFSDVPSVALTPLGQGAAVGPIASLRTGVARAATGFTVEIVSIGTGFVDGTFDFIAVGPA